MITSEVFAKDKRERQASLMQLPSKIVVRGWRGRKTGEGRNLTIERGCLQSQSKWSINFIGPQVCGRKLNNWQRLTAKSNTVIEREGESVRERGRDCTEVVKSVRAGRKTWQQQLLGVLSKPSVLKLFVKHTHTHTHTETHTHTHTII